MPMHGRSADFVAEDHGLRTAAMEESQGYGRITRMGQAPLPFDHEQLMVLVVRHLLFDRAADKIAHHAVDRTTAAGDQNARLPGGDKLGVAALLFQARLLSSMAREHFPDAAIVAHGMNSQALSPQWPALGNLAFIVFAYVHQGCPMPGSRGGELWVVGKKFVQARVDGHFSSDRFQHHRPPGLRDAPPDGAIPIIRPLASGAAASSPTTGTPSTHTEQPLGRLAHLGPVQHAPPLPRGSSVACTWPFWP